jgi:hypothetical protein
MAVSSRKNIGCLWMFVCLTSEDSEKQQTAAKKKPAVGSGETDNISNCVCL